MVVIQFNYNYAFEKFNPSFLVIPFLAAMVFGITIAKIRILQKSYKESLNSLRQKEEEISKINEYLEKKIEEKTQELGENRLHTELILNAQNSIVIISDGNKIYKANRAFFRLLNEYTSLEEFQKDYTCISDLFVIKDGYLVPVIDNMNWIDYVLKHIDAEHRAIIQYEGQEHIFSVHAKKLSYSKFQRVIITFENITKLIRYEENLEAEIQQEIEKSNQKDQIIYKQARFVAMAEVLQAISHHWKQPLSALSLLIQDIEDAKEFNELDDEYVDVFAEKSLKIIKEMDSTIEAFRNIFSTDDLYTKEFLIIDAIEKALHIIKQTITLHNIELVLDIMDPKISVNTYLKEYIQILINIISNAIEALGTKKDDKKIVLTLYLGENEKSVLEIFNNGDQIPKEDIDKIFEPYFSTKFDKNGTGLGLFTSKTFIENQMNGKLYVQNKENGVSFKIVV